MKEKLDFVKLPILLFVLFFLGRLAMGAAMGVNKTSYDLANRIFSMVILEVHVGLLWGAVGRRYKGYGVGGAVTAVVLAVVVSQALIFLGTAGSYVAGIQTFFTFPEALNQTAAVGFGTAIGLRAGSFVANCIIGGISGVIGWALGGLIPADSTRQAGMR
jgi:hypothetical protein